jgi:hypothetical protein
VAAARWNLPLREGTKHPLSAYQSKSSGNRKMTPGEIARLRMSFDKQSEGTKDCHGIASGDHEANQRIAVLTIAERMFTAEEYARLCDDIGKGRVEIRRFEDGFVLVRDFCAAEDSSRR